jgi:hypothetical protein
MTPLSNQILSAKMTRYKKGSATSDKKTLIGERSLCGAFIRTSEMNCIGIYGEVLSDYSASGIPEFGTRDGPCNIEGNFRKPKFFWINSADERIHPDCGRP